MNTHSLLSSAFALVVLARCDRPPPSSPSATADTSVAVATTAPDAPAPSASVLVPPSAPTSSATAAPKTGIPPRDSLDRLPTRVATGAFDTAPPKDWPCAMREHWPDGSERNVRRFVYGRKTGCRLPVQLVDDGVVGCVERIVFLRGKKAYDIARLQYDGPALDRFESNAGVTSYRWVSDVPEPSDGVAPTRSIGRVEWRIVGRSAVDVDDLGRPIRTWSEEKGALATSAEIVWNEGRLERVQHYVHEGGTRRPSLWDELLYDCKALGPLPPSRNAGKELGIPAGGD